MSMTGPIEPVRTVRPSERKPADVRVSEDAAPVAEPALPAPVLPAPEPLAGSSGLTASLEAHLLAQDAQRRGLRGGPQTLTSARQSYLKTEWSGHSDRRRAKGVAAKKDV
jgi:hypothetical protein